MMWLNNNWQTDFFHALWNCIISTFWWVLLRFLACHSLFAIELSLQKSKITTPQQRKGKQIKKKTGVENFILLLCSFISSAHGNLFWRFSSSRHVRPSHFVTGPNSTGWIPVTLTLLHSSCSTVSVETNNMMSHIRSDATKKKKNNPSLFQDAKVSRL